MTRHGWLRKGVVLSMGLLVACGGSDNDEQSNDDGADAGQQDFSDEIKGLRDQIDMLTPKLGELDGRLKTLETPKTPGSCSAGELCIPDGINLAKSGFQPIITAICGELTGCCEVRELHWLYGNAVKTQADCEATFTDLINNGQTESVSEEFGFYLETVVRAAHALNDTGVFVEINAAAVNECAQAISARDCEYWDGAGGEGDGDGDGRCEPDEDLYDGPCSLSKLLTGKERAGDTCSFSEINECGPGLTCRSSGNDEGSSPQSGTCAPKASVGDRCVSGYDCDDLYCDFAAGTCKARAKEGEACAYLDPTFEQIGPNPYGNPDEGTSIDCERGFTCNPLTNTCVPEDCAVGSFCQWNSQCAPTQICSNEASEALQYYSQYPRSFLGVCMPGVADGQPCTWNSREENDCASERCFDHDDDGTDTCQPRQESCDYYCYGDGCDTCPAGFACTYNDVCVPEQANGGQCNAHEECVSRFCNEGTCEAKVASGASCPSYYNQQCPDTEYCNAGTCADAADLGESCAERSCARGLGCLDANGDEDYRCYPYDNRSENFHDLPDGVYCYSYDDWCQSGWCSDGNSLCTARIAQGSECDPENTDDYRCAQGLSCIYDENADLGGVCKPTKLPGEVCDPNLNECGGEFDRCVLHNDQFLCDPYYGDEPLCFYYAGGGGNEI